MRCHTRVLMSAAVAIAVTLLASTPAAANWTIECIWDNLPAATKAELTKPTDRKYPASLGETVEAAASACGARSDDVPLVSRTLILYASRNAALERFKTVHQIPPEVILKEWQVLPAEDRTKFGSFVAKMESNDEELALYSKLSRQLVKGLGVTDPQAAYPLRDLVLSLGGLEGLGRGGLTKP